MTHWESFARGYAAATAAAQGNGEGINRKVKRVEQESRSLGNLYSCLHVRLGLAEAGGRKRKDPPSSGEQSSRVLPSLLPLAPTQTWSPGKQPMPKQTTHKAGASLHPAATMAYRGEGRQSEDWKRHSWA